MVGTSDAEFLCLSLCNWMFLARRMWCQRKGVSKGWKSSTKFIANHWSGHFQQDISMSMTKIFRNKKDSIYIYTQKNANIFHTIHILYTSIIPFLSPYGRLSIAPNINLVETTTVLSEEGFQHKVPGFLKKCPSPGSSRVIARLFSGGQTGWDQPSNSKDLDPRRKDDSKMPCKMWIIWIKLVYSRLYYPVIWGLSWAIILLPKLHPHDFAQHKFSQWGVKPSKTGPCVTSSFDGPLVLKKPHKGANSTYKFAMVERKCRFSKKK